MFDGWVWNDMPCESEGLAICQWKIEYSEDSDDEEYGIVEAGNFFRADNDHMMSWQDASAYCNSWGGELASILSEEEAY